MKKFKKGQVMILNAFLVSSIFLIISGIFSLVIYYQIKQATNFLNSAISFFAADSALEYGLYKYFKVYNANFCSQNICRENPNIIFTNNATATTEYIFEDKGNYIEIKINGFGHDQSKKTVRYLQNIIILNK